MLDKTNQDLAINEKKRMEFHVKVNENFIRKSFDFFKN